MSVTSPSELLRSSLLLKNPTNENENPTLEQLLGQRLLSILVDGYKLKGDTDDHDYEIPPHLKHPEAEILRALLFNHFVGQNPLLQGEIDADFFSVFSRSLDQAALQINAEISKLEAKDYEPVEDSPGITQLDNIALTCESGVAQALVLSYLRREGYSILNSTEGIRLIRRLRKGEQLKEDLFKPLKLGGQITLDYLLSLIPVTSTRNTTVSDKPTYTIEMVAPSLGIRIFAKVYDRKYPAKAKSAELEKQLALQFGRALLRYNIEMPPFISSFSNNEYDIVLYSFEDARNLYEEINAGKGSPALFRQVARQLAVIHHVGKDIQVIKEHSREEPISGDLFLQYIRKRPIYRLKQYLGIDLSQPYEDQKKVSSTLNLFRSRRCKKPQTIEEAFEDACSYLNQELVEAAKSDPVYHKDASPKNWMRNDTILPTDFEFYEERQNGKVYFNGFTAPEIDLACMIAFGRLKEDGTWEDIMSEAERMAFVNEYKTSRESLGKPQIEQAKREKRQELAILQKHLEYIGSSARDIAQSESGDIAIQSNRLYYQLHKAREEASMIAEKYAADPLQQAKYSKLIRVLDRIETLVLSNPKVKVSEQQINMLKAV